MQGVNSLGAILAELIALFLLIGINAYFAIMEIAVVGSRRSRIDQMAHEGSRGARIVQGWLENDDTQSRFIASAQLGVTFASLALGVVGEGAIDSIMVTLFAGVPISPTLSAVMEVLPFMLSLVVVSSMHLVLGEQVPKVTALRAPERMAVMLALPMSIFSRIFSPMISGLNAITGWVLRLLRIQPAGDHTAGYTVEELRQIVRESEKSGLIDEEEYEIIDSVFDIGDLLVRQVMVPRTEMDMLQADTPLYEAARHVIRTPYTKFPIYGKDPDDILGVLYIKDLLEAVLTEHTETVRDLYTETFFVPETLPVTRLMALFRESNKHIAIIYDEYGGTEGLVTLDDVLGQVVGEIPDRYESSDPDHIEMLQLDDQYLVSGLMLIEDFNQMLDLDLNSPDYNTVGGYVMDRLGRVPHVGDTVEIDGAVIQVESMDGLRIDRLSVQRTA